MITAPPLAEYRPRLPGVGLRAARPLPEMCAHHAPRVGCTQCRAPAAPERGVEKQEAQQVAAKVIAKVDRRRVAAREPKPLKPPKLPRAAKPPRAQREPKPVKPPRAVRTVELDGVTYTLRQLVEKFGGNLHTQRQRHATGRWTARQLAGLDPKPPQGGARTRTFTRDGVTLSAYGWAKARGLKVDTVKHRLDDGWTWEEALGLVERKRGRRAA